MRMRGGPPPGGGWVGCVGWVGGWYIGMPPPKGTIGTGAGPGARDSAPQNSQRWTVPGAPSDI